MSKTLHSVSIEINAQRYTADIEARTLLVDFIRDIAGLRGTRTGCDTSQCGACVVHVDGLAVKACSVLAVTCDKAEVLTIEGLATHATEDPASWHPLQRAFHEHHALQCGFCTSGMIMAGLDITRRHNGNPDEQTIRRELNGNLCRCTGYQGIVDAIKGDGGI